MERDERVVRIDKDDMVLSQLHSNKTFIRLQAKHRLILYHPLQKASTREKTSSEICRRVFKARDSPVTVGMNADIEHRGDNTTQVL